MKTYLTSFFAMLSFYAFSQAYTLETVKAPFNYLSDSISLNEGLTWDDHNFEIPLGFNFKFFDQTVSTWYTGFLGSSIATQKDEDVDFGYALISGFGADLIDINYDLQSSDPQPGAGSPVSYRIDGPAGNRIAKIEWRNAGFYYELEEKGSNLMRTNYQIWLYEKDGVIEVHFGPNRVTDPRLVLEDQASAFVFLIPEVGSDDDNIFPSGGVTLGGTPGDVKLVELEPDTRFVPGFEGLFTDGTVLRFTPATSVSADGLKAHTLVVLPNPVQDQLQVQVSGDDAVRVERVSILDINGRTQAQWANQAGGYDVSALAAGVYYLQVATNAGVSIHKLVKH